MYLQLAEGGLYDPFSYLSSASGAGFLPGLAELPGTEDSYIKIPAIFSPSGSEISVREDAFDHLPDRQWHAVMDVILPYQAQGLGGLLWTSKANKAIKNQAKIDRIAARGTARATARAAGPGAGGQVLDTIKSIGSAVAGLVLGGATPQGDIVTPGGDTGQQVIKKWYQQPVLWVVGGAALIGGVALLAKPKKKKR